MLGARTRFWGQGRSQEHIFFFSFVLLVCLLVVCDVRAYDKAKCRMSMINCENYVFSTPAIKRSFLDSLILCSLLLILVLLILLLLFTDIIPKFQAPTKRFKFFFVFLKIVC